jgi:hypothetical protein
LEDHALLLGGAVLAARRCRNLLSNLQAALGEGEYPYERADGRVRLACAVVPWVGSEEEVGAIHAGALDALEAYYTLYLRVLSDLTAAAERVADSFNVGVE